MKHLKKYNEEVSLNIPSIDFLDGDDFYGQLEDWDSYGAIAYDSYPFETPRLISYLTSGYFLFSVFSSSLIIVNILKVL